MRCHAMRCHFTPIPLLWSLLRFLFLWSLHLSSLPSPLISFKISSPLIPSPLTPPFTSDPFSSDPFTSDPSLHLWPIPSPLIPSPLISPNVAVDKDWVSPLVKREDPCAPGRREVSMEIGRTSSTPLPSLLFPVLIMILRSLRTNNFFLAILTSIGS